MPVINRSVVIVYKTLGPRSRVPVGLFPDIREAYQYLFDVLNVGGIEDGRYVSGDVKYTVDTVVVDVSLNLK